MRFSLWYWVSVIIRQIAAPYQTAMKRNLMKRNFWFHLKESTLASNQDRFQGFSLLHRCAVRSFGIRYQFTCRKRLIWIYSIVIKLIMNDHHWLLWLHLILFVVCELNCIVCLQLFVFGILVNLFLEHFLSVRIWVMLLLCKVETVIDKLPGDIIVGR